MAKNKEDKQQHTSTSLEPQFIHRGNIALKKRGKGQKMADIRGTFKLINRKKTNIAMDNKEIDKQTKNSSQNTT